MKYHRQRIHLVLGSCHVVCRYLTLSYSDKRQSPSTQLDILLTCIISMSCMLREVVVVAVSLRIWGICRDGRGSFQISDQLKLETKTVYISRFFLSIFIASLRVSWKLFGEWLGWRNRTSSKQGVKRGYPYLPDPTSRLIDRALNPDTRWGFPVFSNIDTPRRYAPPILPIGQILGAYD